MWYSHGTNKGLWCCMHTTHNKIGTMLHNCRGSVCIVFVSDHHRAMSSSHKPMSAVQHNENAIASRGQQHPTPVHAACDALGKFWQQHVAPKLHNPLQTPKSIDKLNKTKFAQAVAAAEPSQQASPSTIPSTVPSYPPPSYQPTSREELGRATWVLLHTLAAQLPDTPTRQQRRDVRTLIDVLTRIYPCGDCATHWKHIVKAAPPKVDSRVEFEQWLCRAHNTVNRSLGKPLYNCNAVGLRWSALDCDEEQEIGCALGTRGQHTTRRQR